MNLFIKHLPECSLETPCGYCKASQFLREKLSPEDLEIFLTKLHASYRLLIASIEELDLTYRTKASLRQEGILTVADLVQKKENDLLRIPNFGRKSLNEVLAFVRGADLTLGMKL